MKTKVEAEAWSATMEAQGCTATGEIKLSHIELGAAPVVVGIILVVMILVMISRNNATVKVPSPGLSATLKAILFLVGIVVPGVILLGLGSASKDTKLTGFAIV